MSEDRPEAPGAPPTVVVVSVDGSSASDNGELVKIGFTLEQGRRVDAIMATDRGHDLATLVGAALGEARRKATSDETVRYLYPMQSWEVGPQQNSQMLILTFRSPDGMEMCFQVDRNGARNLAEGLLAALGLVESPTIPESQKH